MNQLMQSISFCFALSASTDPPVSCLSWGAYYEGWPGEESSDESWRSAFMDIPPHILNEVELNQPLEY